VNTDPTAIPLNLDPRTQRMTGIAIHGTTPFDVPYVSHVSGNLWTGGCTDRLILPNIFKHLISLYPWERYRVKHKLRSESYFYLYDAGLPDTQLLEHVALLASYCVSDGATLIHCQAGLNRSALIAALVLMRTEGMSGSMAIDLLRRQRSPAVLCNKDFETWLHLIGA